MRNEEITKHYSLKILFGPMFGCELNLPADDYFIIVNPNIALQDKNAEQDIECDHAVHYATNTLYIPCDIVSPNITLFLSESTIDNEGMHFNVEIHDEHGNSFKSLVKENDVFIHEHIRIAVKCRDDEWSGDIKNYNFMASLSAENHDIFQNKVKNKKLLAALLVVFLVFIITSLLSIFTYYRISSDRQVISLSEVLSGAPGPLDIVKGLDNKSIYVLANKLQEMEWAKEAIHKFKDHENIFLVLLSSNKKNIISELYSIGYPVLQLDYSSPTHPTLALYRSLDPSKELTLKNEVLKKIPFAHDVNFIIKTKEQLINDARQGLDRLNVNYRMISMKTGYSLVVKDALNDNTLHALYSFIDNFTQQWGNAFITFSINLDENWLQNKSYVDSSSGYLFLNPRHWYFPLKNKDF